MKKLLYSGKFFVLLSIITFTSSGGLLVTLSQRGGIHAKSSPKYAGSETCKKCHQDIYETHIKTAHFRDSRPANKSSIKGSFSDGKNNFIYNKWMQVKLDKLKDSFYQTSYFNGVQVQREPFDIVVGSGRKGQSYLYWNDNYLYQLPVSYFTNLDAWTNSPGFPMNTIAFDRLIPAECLECHSTHVDFQVNENGETTYDKQSLIYGIDCERCHGNAEDHVKYHLEHPLAKEAQFIAALNKMTQQEKLDVCAQCHSGFRDHLQPPFSFQPGDTLSHFSTPRYLNEEAGTLDVHGNQYGLLTASKCFQRSAAMDCASCHDVHKDEVGKLEVFSARCLACHSGVQHTGITGGRKQKMLRNNCIDCHMPLMPSAAILLNTSGTGTKVPDELRTHKVAIYPLK